MVGVVCRAALGISPGRVYMRGSTPRADHLMSLVSPIIMAVDLVLEIYEYVLIATIIFSWLHAFGVVNPRNQAVATIGDVLYRLTEPVLRPIRRFMPNLGGLDLSPIVVFLAIFVIRQYLRIIVRW
jgi:YggT family protein